MLYIYTILYLVFQVSKVLYNGIYYHRNVTCCLITCSHPCSYQHAAIHMTPCGSYTIEVIPTCEWVTTPAAV